MADLTPAALAAEAVLLGEAIDELVADLNRERARVTTIQAEHDALLADHIELQARWRMTCHALRLARDVLAAADGSCPDHDRQWYGGCPACEQARLVHRTQVALAALDRPFPARPIPRPR